jgi:hypothetical protein
MKLTDEQLQEVIDALESKAESVESGFYGEEDQPGDNLEWIADLRVAALRLKTRNFQSLTATHLEEIECSYGKDEVTEEIETLAEEEEKS